VNKLGGKIIDGLRWRGYDLKDRGWGRTAFGRWLVDTLLLPADLRLIRSSYRRVFGKNPKLLFSRTFNEKLQRNKIFGRHRRQSMYADKIAVRDYVRKTVGEECLVNVLWSGNDLDEARRLKLAAPYVIKCNNGSGSLLFVHDDATFDWAQAKQTVSKWMTRRCDTYGAEWQYRWIKPALLIEAMLPKPAHEDLVDYKFFCFHGRAEFFQVDKLRHTNHQRALFRRSGERLDAGLHYPRYNDGITLPDCLPAMLKMADALSAPEPFARVDLYDVGRPVFGEITLHPGAGLERFTPPEWDLTFGRYW